MSLSLEIVSSFLLSLTPVCSLRKFGASSPSPNWEKGWEGVKTQGINSKILNSHTLKFNFSVNKYLYEAYKGLMALGFSKGYIRRFKRYSYSISLLIFIILLSLILQSCDRDKNHPGYDYFPDMAYSRAYETYDPNPNFKDRKTLLAPVPGTVSRGAEYYPYEKTDEDILKAARMKNPLYPGLENIERGKVVYQNICLHCHGAKADGKGHLFLSGKYPFPPANLLSEKTRNRTDGELYHIITVGIGIMGPHQIIVQPMDRWKTVLYLRSLQESIK